MAQGAEEQLKVARLGFIGAGAMGGALLRGLLAAGRIKAAELVFCDPDPKRQQEMEKLGIEAALDNAEVMHSPVVVLAVKPQILKKVLEEIRDFIRPWHLVISIAAGVPLAVLEEALPEGRVIRADLGVRRVMVTEEGLLVVSLQRGGAAERGVVERNIALVPLPVADPVHGADGPLLRLWRDA